MSTAISNSAHGPGRTCLAFSADGSVTYTGGSDCIVRIWKTALGTNQEPDVASEADEAIVSVASARDCWISGSVDAQVRRYVKCKPELAGVVANAAENPVECIAIDPKGSKVAVTSAALSTKIIDIEDTSKFCLLEGHTKRVRKVSWHPSGSLITTCGSDGNIIVWDVSEDEPKIVQAIEGIIPAVNDTEPEFVHDCSVIWHPSGQHFYAPSRTHEIVNVSRETWIKSSTISDNSVSGVITALALSTNGVYLASASNSEVFIWSTQTRRLLFRHLGSPGATITQLAFSPTQNTLAWTDNEGNFFRWPQPIPDTLPDPVKISSTGSATISINRKPDDTFLFGDNDNDDVGMDDLGDDWIIDDLGGRMTDNEHEEKSRKSDFVKEMVSITKAQPAFQPGSTPMESKKRYLAYNMIGVIEVTDQDTHHIVNVEFHDQSARKGYHFTDHHKYNLGYLGERGALFACQPENEHPAQVLYKPYGTWTSQGEWSYQLRRDVRVIGVAAGGVIATESLRRPLDDLQGFGNVVVATSEGDLTFLSGTGRERRIMGLGAEYVSMVAGSEWVFVIHRAGSTTIDGSQNLSYSLFNYEDFSVRQTGILPLIKGHILKWIGITDEGAPAIYDTAGWLHVLTKFRVPMGATWARIMDTNLLERREGKDESYWPVGIAASTFMCLILKGRQEHPHFPRPLIQELPIRMPFRRDPEEATPEESIEREILLLEMRRDELGDELITDDIAKREMAMDKEFVRLIQIACKKDNIPRAIEVTKLLHHTVSFDMAIKVAEFYHMAGLREKIEILKANREQEDRLAIARDKRRQWAKPDRPPRLLSARDPTPPPPKPLQDYSKPPTIPRPGLTRGTPCIEHTRYSSAALPVTSADSPSTTFSTSPEGKRKRSDGEDLGVDISKRRAVDEPAPPPKPATSNPFTRKPENKNPFARKSEPNKIIQKSDSFFDKVDAVESQNPKEKRAIGSKGKEKEKKDATRQTTLFGLIPGPTGDKKARNKRTIESQGPKDADFLEGQLNTQATDMSMTDIAQSSDAATLVETQSDESQEPSQTQMEIESQVQLNGSLREESSPEPIEWPPSPPATTTLGSDGAAVEVN